MNNLERNLLRYVCDGDIRNAKQYAKYILENDKTEKNKSFCNTLLTKLNNSALNIIEVPHNLKGLLEIEDVAVSFNEKRYFLSAREKEVAERIVKMQNTSQRLAEMGVRFLNSTLVYGESGTGKTTFGRYLAYRMGVPFVYLNFSQLIDSLLGKTGNNISRVFDFLKSHDDCVLMCDEIDAIGIKRGQSNEVGEISRMVISLMQAMDTLPNNIVFLGGTNIRNRLDDALVRRFTIHHEVKRHSADERFSMAQQFFDDVEYPYDNLWLLDFVSEERTQAQLMNEMVFLLADYIQKKV